MKTSADFIFKKEKVVNLFFTIVFFFNISQVSNAQELSNLQSILHELEKSKKITVVLSMPNPYNGKLERRESERYEGNSVEEFRAHGCNFVSSQKKSISKIIESLRDNQIVRSHYNYLPYASIAIFFSDTKDNETRLLIGRQYINTSTVDSELTWPLSSEPQKLSIGKNIYRDIFSWIGTDTTQELGHLKIGDYRASNNEEHHIRACNKLTQLNYYQISPKQTCTSSDFEQALPNECPAGWEPAMKKNFNK